jgi:bacillopeptidase F (M6 metalloprotease family)
MVYGPFGLTSATAADLSFKLWLNSESDWDFVCRGASINGVDFYGICTSGATGDWIDRVLDLSNVPTLGNLMGQSDVWIMLEFYSDSMANYAEGGYVDDIVLRKCTAPACAGMGSTVSYSGNGRVVEFPRMITLPR